VGEKPWHGLGAELTANADLETWRREAGLDSHVKESRVTFNDGDQAREFEGRKVLYRSDTGAPLSVMSDGFHVVQPADILNLYSEIAKASGFCLETAGALDQGRRVWALAKVSDGADIVNRDRVRPYILLATSFDGSMATTAKFTAIRVVCHNTITAAVGGTIAGRPVKGEQDETAAGKQQVVRVLHSVKWTDEIAKQVRMDLGIVHNQFERFVVESQALAGKTMNATEADDFVAFLLEPYVKTKKKDGVVTNVRDTKGYRRILELFQGGAKGAELVGDTRWAMLNAVTEFIDHERGGSDSSRLESAWFGTGNAIKDRAFRILAGEFERVAA
jgi:phage/plasmid-like protein (TIGR03299 family)